MRCPTMWYVQPTKAQISLHKLCWSLECFNNTKLLTKHHLELLSLRGGCTGLSESSLVKMPDCVNSYVVAHIESLTNPKPNQESKP